MQKKNTARARDVSRTPFVVVKEKKLIHGLEMHLEPLSTSLGAKVSVVVT
jgi:hypothetical protein